ncbi:ribosome small subunit-dependent GTPase A [Paenibacillus sp. JX-17]|uniref:Small ribosomal subunit biogenesis GTPase RsgA n=1 Tax=Paenibacillus lacisoli TaxID=3064525 RepID=A0ABT9CCM2_9BACL|nr:ribosome small subunit-dependent GTPase A [Paenibacillus sp. JX-17]MDO7905727.1 ribosome small subunit-dependent GTPase A [Paenibacillus sp. JX-17]
MTIEHYGWNADRNKKWETWLEANQERRAGKDYVPARVTGDYGMGLKLVSDKGEVWGQVSGRLRHHTLLEGDLPAVGDWVIISDGEDTAVIHGVLERSSRISRQAAGNQIREQLIAANVDTLLLVTALNHDFNPRRLERYLIMAWNSGANPIIVLSKRDLSDCVEQQLAEVERIAPGVPVVAVSALQELGKEQLEQILVPGNTIAMTGTSGCGKSTMLNWLSGASIQQTQGVREEDSRGRHTTTARQMFVLPQGAIMIDTPGMRELTLWEEGTGLSSAFGDIEDLAQDCKFSDCRHQSETGCAVRKAMDEGVLPSERLTSYLKLQYQARKEAESLRRKQQGKSFSGKTRQGKQR